MQPEKGRRVSYRFFVWFDVTLQDDVFQNAGLLAQRAKEEDLLWSHNRYVSMMRS